MRKDVPRWHLLSQIRGVARRSPPVRGLLDSGSMLRQYEAVSPGTLRWVARAFVIGTVAIIAATIAVIAMDDHAWRRTITTRDPCVVGMVDAIAATRDGADTWNTPYRLSCNRLDGGDVAIEMTSAGPDRRFGTDDDLVTRRLWSVYF
jgi:hypothetical protein